jgi:hypothetical protein
MDSSSLRRHGLGFLQIANMPTASELQDYYATVYYQEEKSCYSHVYSAVENNVRKLRQYRLVEKALSLRDSQFSLVGGGDFLTWVAAKVSCSVK